MKIVPIFAGKLYSFHYDGQELNEYDRLLDLWYDVQFLYQFLKDHAKDLPVNISVPDLVHSIRQDVAFLDDLLCDPDTNYDHFFKPLHNQQYQVKVLLLSKGREHFLRLYALRIDKGCYAITGGVIKFTHLMEDRPHTQHELNKLNQAREYLKSEGIIDLDSFFEFLNEDAQ